MTDKAREPAEVSRPLTGYLWGVLAVLPSGGRIYPKPTVKLGH
ncbi:hypothetical protein [Halomonas sp. Ps84H-12]